MRFLPTLDLWNPAIASAVRTGQIKLQVGQWIRCGSDNLSRYVKTTRSSVWVVHPQGARGITPQRFSHLSRVWRGLPNKKINNKPSGDSSPT